MAKANGNLLLKNVGGQIGRQLVVKQYANKTIITAFFGMPEDKPAELQLLYRKRFGDAVRYANSIAGNPVLSAVYEAKVKPGQKGTNYAIAGY